MQQLTRYILVLSALLLLAPSLVQAQQPERTHLVTRLNRAMMALPDIPDGYEQILASPGFESHDGNWYEYNVYPIGTDGLVECDLFAAEGSCYAWLCAKDYCTHDIRQPIWKLTRWEDVRIDFFFHIESYEEQQSPEHDFDDWADLKFLDMAISERMVGYVRGWGNWEVTGNWVYEQYSVDTAWFPDWVFLAFDAHTDSQDWTGFYLDGLRLYGIPRYPYKSNQPVIIN